MTNIITLTDAAIAHIRHIIARRGSGIGFRITVKQTGCSGYMYVPEVVDAVPEGDIEQSQTEGLRIFIDPHYQAILQGTQLDYVKKELGMQMLQFNNPNAEGLCGCGESFKLKECSDE